MMSYRTGEGKTLSVGPRLGKGGEGEVRLISGEPALVVKLYTDGNAEARREKIEAMVQAGLYKHSRNVTFPVSSVFSGAGAFAGFTMSKVAGFKPVHELYAPGSRKLEFPKANFPFLLRTAVNIARAVATVHKIGCVIGDINHSGIMVRADATVSLIDSDSFQVRAKNRIFRCRVGVGEYTPPELQGQKLENVDRTENHDAFGLAVMMFQLLFMGRHPFAGRFNGKEDMPIERAIREDRFVYGARAGKMRMEPPPGVPTLKDIPSETAEVFEAAFTMGNKKRPGAARWVEVLSRFEKELVVCRKTPSHHYARNAAKCPWCTFEAETGIRLFPLSLVKAPSAASHAINVDRIIAAMDAVAPPPKAPDPLTVVAKPDGLTPSPQSLKMRKQRNILLLALAVAAILAAGFVALQIWWAVAVFAVAIPFAAIGFRPWLAVRAARRKARANWRAAALAWQAERGPPRFEERRNELKKMAEDYRHLPELEQRNLAALDGHKREIQLQTFLEAFSIIAADLPKIGEGRRATLASYGIETAWDVTEQAIRGVPGFSDLLAKNLLAWRKKCESRFVFDPAKPVSRDAIRNVKDDLLRLRLDLEHVLRHGRAELETLAHSSAAAQTKSSPELDQAYLAMKQAECDVTGPPRPSDVKFNQKRAILPERLLHKLRAILKR